MRGWGAQAQRVVRTVWGPHPVRISDQIDPLYGLSLDGMTPMRRPELQSAVNGSRFTGDLGPLQTFGRVFGFSPDMVRSGRASLPTANGGSATASSMLDLLGATVG
jgi:hypothetical protein